VRTSLFILLVAASAAAPAQQLGTLFHSQKERDTLDRMRRGESVDQAVAPLPDPVITGFVKRSDGKSTVFIDKRPYPARDPRMQGAIEPRLIQRYEPHPLPPSLPAAAIAPEVSAKPATAKQEPSPRPKDGKED
jgi:hypothetical protein